MRRADLAERIDTVEHRMGSIEQRLDASYTSLSTQILQSRRENDDAHLAMRTEFSEGMSTLRGEFTAMRADVAGEFKAVRTEVAEQFAATQAVTLSRFEKLETALADGLKETRRFMMILHEDLLSRIALIGEGRPSSS
jgi:hypothetical protein